MRARYPHSEGFVERDGVKVSYEAFGSEFSRYLGPEVPAEEMIWQDPIPAVTYKTIDDFAQKEIEWLLSIGLPFESGIVRTISLSVSKSELSSPKMPNMVRVIPR